MDATAVRILAIDPGSERSAWLLLQDGRPKLMGGTATDEPMYAHGIEANDDVLEALRVGGAPGTGLLVDVDVVVIEQMRGFLRTAGLEVFETCRWAGRFEEAARPTPVALVGRKEVVVHLTGSARSGDVEVRAALIDRFGGVGGKAAAVGLKASPGPLYGIAKDVWSALAIALTYAETAA